MVDYQFKKNYLVMIGNAARGENWMFRNFYILENGNNKDVYEDGSWSCSIFLSAILYLQNSLLEFLKKPRWIQFTHAKVESTERDMLANGWYEIKELWPGAVIFWEKKMGNNNGRMHSHCGFCVGETKAVSNDSKGTGFPYKHHITYNGTREIEKIYWHPELDDK